MTKWASLRRPIVFMSKTRGGSLDSSLRHVGCLALVVLFTLSSSCDRQPSRSERRATDMPAITLEPAVREDGTATQLWTNGIAIAIGADAAIELAGDSLPLSQQAEAWLQVLRETLPRVEFRSHELARLFDVPPIDAIIVAGNRGSSDGFGWVPNYIGINLQAFVDAYGPPGENAADRMVRIAAHEYLHLLSYAFYPDHHELRDTPLDRALWTIFFEGIGDYVSMSGRWLPDQDGSYSKIAAERLKELEPILVDRLEKLAAASKELEDELRAGISMGRFEEKWGSLPFALWLHREVSRCGEADTLRAVLRLERDSVLLLALRHATPRLMPRIKAVQDGLGRMPDSVAGSNSTCLALRREP